MPNLSPRHLQRELALKVIFSTFQHPVEDVDPFVLYVKEQFFPKLKKTDFALELVQKALENRKENHSWISEFAKSFALEKTNPVDISILELLLTEVFRLKSPTPLPVAVNEALILANEYGKEGSASFVNGVIAKVNQKYGKSSK